MSHHRGSMSMATLGGDARRKSILPDYKMLMRSDDGRFNHILYQAGPWAEWQARAPSQLAAHGIDGTNLWEATQFEADRPRYGKPDRPGGACGMLSTYGTSPQQPRRLRSPNRIFAGENDAEGAHEAEDPDAAHDADAAEDPDAAENPERWQARFRVSFLGLWPPLQ